MRVNKIVRCLPLILASLLLVLTPCSALAQEGKIGLTLRLVPGDYYNNLVPGGDNTFSLMISNTGNKTLTNIRLYSYPPKDWVVEFKPDSIDSIKDGSFQTVNINIKPPESVSKRDYAVTVVAESSETRAVMDFWFRIETGISVWLWVGVIVAAIVVAGFILVFLRFGRQ